MTDFRFKPVYVAVLLCALAVVALWQPYMHSEIQHKILVTTGFFSTEQEAANLIWAVRPPMSYSDELYEREVIKERSYYVMLGNGTIAHYEEWRGLLYEKVPVTVYDTTSHVLLIGVPTPKLVWAGLFLAAVAGAVLWDATRKEDSP